MTFRKQLLAERERLNLTQDEAAKLLGIGRRTLQKWEDSRDQAPSEITQEGALARLAARPTPVELPGPCPAQIAGP